MINQPKMRKKKLSALFQHIQLLMRNYSIYRSQIIVVILLGALFEVMVAVQRDRADVRFTVMVYGEVLLPQIVGWIATNILLGDPCRELLFASNRPIWKIIFERLELIFLTAMLSFGILLTLTYIIKGVEYFPKNGWELFWGCAISCFLFMSIGVAFSIWLRNRIAGGVVMTGLWASALLFKQNILSSYIGHNFYPFLTLDMPNSPNWSINRLILFTFSLILMIWMLRLTQYEEVLLPNGETEDLG